jgi:putative ABC transport system permease protein
MQEGKQLPVVLTCLRWFCPVGLYEGIEGDLLEAYERDIAESGEKIAKRRLLWNAIRFFNLEILLRNRITRKLINTVMIGNYVKVASRNILKRKLYSFINAVGLSVGIAFCILIYLFIQDEKSFDQFQVNKARIFRMEEKSFDTWQPKPEHPFNRSAWLQTALRQALKDELPEVEASTRFSAGASGIFRSGDKVFTEKNVAYVDRDFFKMFSFPLLSGNVDKLFQNNTDMVITPAIARKYFGKVDAVGKTVQFDDEGEKSYTIAGIIEPPPANSSLDFAILIPQENRPGYARNMKNWGNFNTPTFVQLGPNTNRSTFRRNLDKVVQKYMGDRLEKWRKRSPIPIPPGVKMFELEFTALPDIHLKKEIAWHKVSDPQYSFILAGIATLILLIACINYISLALTTSTARKTEVGIRKVVGAQKSQLVSQFGFESLALAGISMLIGLGLVVLFLPAFNSFTGKGITLTGVNLLQLSGVSVVLTLVVGVVAGCYPALVLSGFRPVSVLKSRFTSKLQSGFTRPLVIVQFALSAFLIISSVIMYRQMRFVTTKNLGYDKEQVVVIPTQTGWNREADKTVERFRTRVQQVPSIVSVSGSTSSFNQGFSRYGYKIKGEQKAAFVFGVDPYYLPTLGMELVKGRNFDPAIASDSSALIVNEALVRDMKWTDPLNEYLNWREDSLGLGSRIIGVVKDYHFLSLENNIEPMFMSMNKKDIGYLVFMLVKITPGDVPGTLETIHTLWRELSPDKPFDYTFLDQDVARQYEAYERWMSIMGLATGFAILISCLGLFGLAGINAVNRTKEIGIRKVLGAEVGNIFILLNRQYFWLSLIAFALAAPLSWYIMNKWLADFKFKIAIRWELFAWSMAAGLLVAMITVSYHAIKAAMINPADTLKYE